MHRTRINGACSRPTLGVSRLVARVIRRTAQLHLTSPCDGGDGVASGLAGWSSDSGRGCGAAQPQINSNAKAAAALNMTFSVERQNESGHSRHADLSATVPVVMGRLNRCRDTRNGAFGTSARGTQIEPNSMSAERDSACTWRNEFRRRSHPGLEWLTKYERYGFLLWPLCSWPLCS